MFFVCVVFFILERNRKRKNYECDGLGNPIPYKMMFVSATRSKTVGENVFLMAEVQFFRGMEKHIVT